jgi:cyclohexyl-isocyanide hydratase
MMFNPQIPPITIGMVLFPNLNQLEFTAPYEIFSHLPGAQIHRLAPTIDPIYSESGLPLIPDTPFEKAPHLDILFIPGGLGLSAKLEDAEFLGSLRKWGEEARYVTSIGDGALLLAAASLLKGYRATTDWSSLELLDLLGVEAVSQQIVVDRNRITASNITDGIPFALTIAYEMFGAEIVQEIKMRLDYNPAQLALNNSIATPSDAHARVKTDKQLLAKIRLKIIQQTIQQQAI